MKQFFISLIAMFFLIGAVGICNATPIKVAVFQDSSHSSADAAGHVVNQLNDDTYFDFSASHITAGTDLDTVLELAAFDVVIIGDDGYGHSVDDWHQMGSAMKSWVNSGGSLVTTAWTVYYADLDNDIKDILPVYGANQWVNNALLDITNSTHAITNGVNDFVSSSYQNYGTLKSGADGLGTVGSGSAVATWEYGTGRVVSLSPLYMGSRSAYGTGLNGLELGDADRLLEQATAYAANNSAPIPEPSTWLLLCFGLLGMIGIKKKLS